MRKVLEGIKCIFLWILSACFLITSLCFLPGIAGFLGLVLAAWLIPIPKWQAQFPQGLHGKRKAILVIGLFFILCGAIPNQTAVEEAEQMDIPYATELAAESITESSIPQIIETTVATTEATTEATTLATAPATTAAPVVVTTESTTATTVATTVATTQAPTEPATEAPVETTVPPTEAFTEVSTEAPTEAITEATTEPATEPATEAIPEETENADEAVVWVWIPKSGSKYHSKSTCSNMKEPSQATIEDAIAWGYTACSKCY